MNDEWLKYYSPKRKTDSGKQSFIKTCNIIESIGGELIGKYTRIDEPIKIKIDKYIIYRRPVDLPYTLKGINDFKKEVLDNNDIFLNLVFYENNPKSFARIKTYDGAEIDVAIHAYWSFSLAREKFLNLVNENNHTIMSSYLGKQNKVLINYKCGHQPHWVTPESYSQGCRCPVCSGYKVETGYTDIATTHPEYVKYFYNQEDAYNYSFGSSVEVMFKCPDCGFKKKMRIQFLFDSRFHCNRCGNKNSYPNKIMFSLLEFLNQEFEIEKKFEWCTFQRWNSNDMTYGIYDFVLEDKKIIIEMDGGFHNNDNCISGKSKEESNYIDDTKDMLARKHGYKIIRINANYSTIKERFGFIKENILNSKLSNIFDLTNVEWLEIEKLSASNMIKNVCDIWNMGIGTSGIEKETKLSNPTIVRYLKYGYNFGWCDYTPDKGKNRIVQNLIIAFNNKDIIGVYTNFSEAAKILSEVYNTYFDRHYISDVCNKKTLKYKDVYFKYITLSQYNTYIKTQSPELAFGDYFILPEETT